MRTGCRRFCLRPNGRICINFTVHPRRGIISASPCSGSFRGFFKGTVEGFSAFTAALIGQPQGVVCETLRLLVIGLMEQALFENRMRNLLWLLTTAPSYPLRLGLSEANARIPTKEQSTAEIGANVVSPLGETIEFGAAELGADTTIFGVA
jgi:hypothetical protein